MRRSVPKSSINQKQHQSPQISKACWRFCKKYKHSLPFPHGLKVNLRFGPSWCEHCHSPLKRFLMLAWRDSTLMELSWVSKNGKNLSCPVLTRTGRTWCSPITNLNEWHQNKAATVSPPSEWSTQTDRRFPISLLVAPTQVERSMACSGFDLPPFLLLWQTFVAAKLKRLLTRPG